MAQISRSRRVRRTPFTDGVEAAGVTGYTVYNRMLLPTVFRSVEEDYHHLKSAVQVWDVAVERQVQIKGADARHLLEIITPRDLETLTRDRAVYAPICDQYGGMLNDPVALQVDEDTFWVSLADSDLLLWIKAIGAAYRFMSEVTEPDVSPLAVQGPKANELMARVFGEEVTKLKFFGCGRFAFQDRDFVVTRSGYSKQGGFEIYVEGHDYGMPLWNALFEAGADLDVRAGCPNLIERIEGGMLSYGNDMTPENTPLECGLGKYVNDNRLDFCFGGRVMKEERAAGSTQMVRAISIDGDIPPSDRAWPLMAGETRVGQVTSAAKSPDFKTNVAIGMVAADHWDAGTELVVQTQDGPRDAIVNEKFWI